MLPAAARYRGVHQVFITPGGLYMVTTSLEDWDKDPAAAAEDLEFWLTTVHLHAHGAKIFVAATKLDLVDAACVRPKLDAAIESRLSQALTK